MCRQCWSLLNSFAFPSVHHPSSHPYTAVFEPGALPYTSKIECLFLTEIFLLSLLILIAVLNRMKKDTFFFIFLLTNMFSKIFVKRQVTFCEKIVFHCVKIEKREPENMLYFIKLRYAYKAFICFGVP